MDIVSILDDMKSVINPMSEEEIRVKIRNVLVDEHREHVEKFVDKYTELILFARRSVSEEKKSLYSIKTKSRIYYLSKRFGISIPEIILGPQTNNGQPEARYCPYCGRKSIRNVNTKHEKYCSRCNISCRIRFGGKFV